jgi:DNA repair protein RecO (recombination protein O)
MHAFFLHTRPYRESSLLADVFTAESGRISAILRSARSNKSNAPQLFQPLLIEAVGHTELKNLRQIERVGMALPLTGFSLFSAFYLNEILMRLLPREEVQHDVFVAYSEALGGLAEGGDSASLLRAFECALLHGLGFGIDFGHDSERGEPVLAAFNYDFHPERGFFRSASRTALSGSLLQQLAAGNFVGQEVAAAAKRINRLALAKLLGNKPLKSRELFLVAREGK